MSRLRYACAALLVGMMLVSTTVRADDTDPSAADLLAQAIKLFDAGDYDGARALLDKLDPDELKDEVQQVQLQKYLTDTTTAIGAQADARHDLELADSLMSSGKGAEAKPIYNRILTNKYAPADTKARASAKLAEIDRPAAPASSGATIQMHEVTGTSNATKPATTSTPPAPPPARTTPSTSGTVPMEEMHEIRPGASAVSNNPPARTSPPQAVQPITPASSTAAPVRSSGPVQPMELLDSRSAPASTTTVQSPSSSSSVTAPGTTGLFTPGSSGTSRAIGASNIVDEVAEEHELLWQQAEKTYRVTEEKIKKAVIANDFAEAHQLMDYARQAIEANRRFANPPSRYEQFRDHAVQLARYIDDEEKAYEESEITEASREIADREAQRIALIEESKRKQIDQLMNHAIELRKERRYEDAIQVLKQLLAIDPENQNAAVMKETLEDIAVHVRDRNATTVRRDEAQDLFVETEEALIPWHKDVLYPKNWAEITAKRQSAAEVTESEANRTITRKLQQTAPEINFDGITFEQVVDYLRDLTGLNIVVNWTALETAAIEKDKEVSLKLAAGTVKIETALKLILEEVGAGETDLAYEIGDGVIQISTKEDLARRTTVQVYNVQDLIIRVDDFAGRTVNLNQIGQQQQGGLGGAQGGGGGGGGGIFEQGAGQQQQPQNDNGADNLARLIQLIQETIDPESWRSAGGNVGAISDLNNQVIVTQTSTAHNQLRDLLKQLRQARALQIAVEARYITVSRNYLEQIGVDLDVVLNNGNAGFDRAGFQNTPLRDPATGALVLVPRQFSRLGFTPGAPAGIGVPLPTQSFPQPFGQPGLVPAPGSLGPHSGTWTPIPIINNTLDLATPVATNIPGSLGGADTSPAFQMFGSFLDNIQVDFLLRATQVDNRASDLDAPRLVLFNGQRATFQAFIEQDYVSALTPVLGDNVGLFQPIINTALTGRSLDVRATVTADRRYVTMTIQTFTQVSGDPVPFQFAGGSTTGGAGFVQLIRRTTQQIQTTVSVPDGGTLLIGGLKQSAERETDAGVPILSRIPILKRAYSNTALVKDDQVLLILIKPKIIIQEEAEAEAFPTLSTAGGG